jgi:hypothetical protein
MLYSFFNGFLKRDMNIRETLKVNVLYNFIYTFVNVLLKIIGVENKAIVLHVVKHCTVGFIEVKAWSARPTRLNMQFNGILTAYFFLYVGLLASPTGGKNIFITRIPQ